MKASNKRSQLNITFKGLGLACLILWALAGCSDQGKYTELKADIVSPSRNIEIIGGEAVYFGGEVSGGVAPYIYSWNFSAVAPPSSEKNPGEIVFNYEGAYKVSFTVKDAKGSSHTDQVHINVEEDTYSLKKQAIKSCLDQIKNLV